MTVFTGTDLIFNDYNFSEIVKVEHIRRPLINVENHKIEGKDRVFCRGSRLVPDLIEIDVRIIESKRANIENVKRIMMKHLYTDEAKILKTRDSELYDIAKLDGKIDFDKFLYTGFCTLKFMPMYAFRFGMFVDTIVRGDEIIIPNGHVETPPVFEIVPSADVGSVKITSINLGEFVKVDYDIRKDSKLVIDCDREIVTYNGYNILKYVSFESDFFKLVPEKENRVKIEGASEARMIYTERWLA